MADTRVADLADSGVPAADDLLYVVDSSEGPPRDRKLTVANLSAAIKTGSILTGQNGGVATQKMLYGVLGSTDQPVFLLDENGEHINLNAYPSGSATVTFSALISATIEGISGGSAHRIDGAAYRLGGSTFSTIAAPIITVLADNILADGPSVAVFGSELQFSYKGIDWYGYKIFALVTLVYTLSSVMVEDPTP